MTRTPTPRETQLDWHTNALLGVYGDGAAITSEPQCGWFKRRLVRGGPWIPGRIWMFQDVDAETGELLSDETLQCELNGQYADADDQWLSFCKHPIPQHEFLYLTEAQSWARRNDPRDALANPNKQIDWLKVSLPYF